MSTFKLLTLLLPTKNLTPAVAFHAQQAIEKTLKAIIVNFGNEIPRIHDLVTLTSKAGELLNIQIDHRTLVLLNQAYSRARYPMELSQDDMAIQGPQENGSLLREHRLALLLDDRMVGSTKAVRGCVGSYTGGVLFSPMLADGVSVFQEVIKYIRGHASLAART